MKIEASPEGTALDRRSFLELNAALGIAALGSFAGARAADPADDIVRIHVGSDSCQRNPGREVLEC
jgi:hypothetical protein